jgi:hypothetical protein
MLAGLQTEGGQHGENQKGNLEFLHTTEHFLKVNLRQLFSCFLLCNALFELGFRSSELKV